MAITLPYARSSRTFDRHIKRLVWCALLGSIALLVPLARDGATVDTSLTVALGAVVMVVAVLTVVRDVNRYVRLETARRRAAARASRMAGACGAADAIQDRVANLLSVTVGYADFLANDQQLTEQTRLQAQRALDSALAAARAVSAFRQSLGCESSVGVAWAERHQLRPQPGDIRTPDGAQRLVAEAPAVWNVLNDAQQLAISLLASGPRESAEELRIRELLERINALNQRLEP